MSQKSKRAILIVCGVAIALLLSLSTMFSSKEQASLLNKVSTTELADQTANKEQSDGGGNYSTLLYKIFVRNLPYLNNK